MSEEQTSIPANLPKGYPDTVASMSDDKLKSELAELQVTLNKTHEAMDADPDVIDAKAALKEVKKPYLDVIREQEAKQQWCGKLFEERGMKAKTTKLNQGKLALGEPAKKQRRTSPKKAAKKARKSKAK